MQNVAGIILMGGEGVRFGSALPKQFHRLSGKKVYLHTLERLMRGAMFEEILLVTHEHWIEEVRSDIASYNDPSLRVVAAGKTRQESSLKGLLACKKDTRIVVIHDAVRPFVDDAIIKKNIECASLYGAADTCIASADTLVHSPSGIEIEKIPLRSSYFRGQTPQSFDYGLILKAHQASSHNNASDDCALVLALGHPVHIVEGNERNIKITTELDLFLADQLIRMEKLHLPAIEKSLAGKCYAITGGTGGIGTALAALLRQEGAMPLLISRSSKDYPCDLSTYENVSNLFGDLHRKYGAMDGLINCMGLLKLKEIEALSQEEIHELLQINLASPIYCCKCATIKEGGHLVNVGSSSYVRGRKNYAIYSSAKAALVNFTQGLAEERPNLNINTIVPGRTNTRMRHENFPEEDESSLLQPQEVASVIVNLLKQDSLTGSIIKI